MGFFGVFSSAWIQQVRILLKLRQNLITQHWSWWTVWWSHLPATRLHKECGSKIRLLSLPAEHLWYYRHRAFLCERKRFECFNSLNHCYNSCLWEHSTRLVTSDLYLFFDLFDPQSTLAHFNLSETVNDYEIVVSYSAIKLSFSTLTSLLDDFKLWESTVMVSILLVAILVFLFIARGLRHLLSELLYLFPTVFSMLLDQIPLFNCRSFHQTWTWF